MFHHDDMHFTRMNSVGKARPFVIYLVSCDFVHQNQKFRWRVHGSAGLVTVDKEYKAAGIVLKLSQNSLVAIEQACRRLSVQSVDAAKELPLVPRQFDPFAVPSGDRVLRHRDVNAADHGVLAGADVWR